MIPSATSVVRARYWLAAAIRVTAIAWFVVEARTIPGELIGLGAGVLAGQIFTSGLVSVVVPLVSALLGAMVVPGLLLVFERRLVRWMVPEPRLACPSCGYPVEKLKSPVCPECGGDIRSVSSSKG